MRKKNDPNQISAPLLQDVPADVAMVVRLSLEQVRKGLHGCPDPTTSIISLRAIKHFEEVLNKNMELAGLRLG